MSWRTLVVSRRCKLDLCMNYLEIRSEEVKKVHLSELHTLIIESTAVSLTAALLNELIHRKVKVIFCDEKRNPASELIPYYGSHDSSACIRQQMAWDQDTKGLLWAEIIAQKIRNQQDLLRECGEIEKAELLGQYINNIEEADASNREGHAARVYFTGLFGQHFSRSMETPVNAALNYGYSILLSAFNKEIAGAGYLTQIGIFHDNMFNPFNLASDLMEPFRPLVDRMVWKMKPAQFEKEEKVTLLNILNQKVIIDRQSHFVANAVKIYTRSVIDALNDRKAEGILFYTLDQEKQNNPKNRPGHAEKMEKSGSALAQKVEKLLQTNRPDSQRI